MPEPVLEALFSTEEGTKRGLVQVLRETIQKDGVQGALSFRALIGISKMLPFYGWNAAVLYNFCHDFDEEFEGVIKETIKSKLGHWAEPTDDRRFVDKYRDEIKRKGFPLPPI